MPINFYDENQKYIRKPTLNLGPLSCQGSTQLYWNRALLELEDLHDLTPSLKSFLEHKFESDHSGMLGKLQAAMESQDDSTSFANVMDAGMDWVYLFCNIYNTFAPFIKPLAMVIPGLGVAWNLFDSIGAAALAAHEGSQGDQWAKKVNYGSALQLSACTGVTIASLCMPAVSALGFAGTVTGGFGFAAAMAISWGLEKRAVNLCDKRIEYLVKEEIDDDAVTKDYNDWRKAIDDKKSSEIIKQHKQNLNDSLNASEKNLTIQGNKPKKLLSVKMCRKQVKEREMHSRMCSVWKWCTVAMTSVAMVGTVALAVGISVATCGIGLAVGASVIASASAGYRIYQKKQAAKAELGDGLDRKKSTLTIDQKKHTLHNFDDGESKEKLSVYSKQNSSLSENSNAELEKLKNRVLKDVLTGITAFQTRNKKALDMPDSDQNTYATRAKTKLKYLITAQEAIKKVSTKDALINSLRKYNQVANRNTAKHTGWGKTKTPPLLFANYERLQSQTSKNEPSLS